MRFDIVTVNLLNASSLLLGCSVTPKRKRGKDYWWHCPNCEANVIPLDHGSSLTHASSSEVDAPKHLPHVSCGSQLELCPGTRYGMG
ncbi:hypothetical protein KC316_g28 [Hortaea werneckii]|nr:hypothetical protein KC316_g28 [Hortaea werneckii]